jgi:CHAD domain-containing protein/CYTH domain-containing protein
VALPPDILYLPAPQGARLVALERLDRLLDARVRLGHAEDTEALHDFRVALRRLRSVLRAYRKPLASSIGPGMYRRLRRLAAATSESRDLEVHLAWLEEQRATLTPKQRIGLDAMRARLVERKATADARLELAIGTTFPHLAHRVRRRLARYDAPVLGGVVNADPPFAAAMAGRARRKIEQLRVALDAVHGVSDEADAHRARIIAKRLRYLLDPVGGMVPGAEEVSDKVRELQDQLGALHDAHVFAPELVAATSAAAGEHARRESLAVVSGGSQGRAAKRVHGRDPRPGLIELGERVRARGEAAFSQVRGSWLDGRAVGFFANAERFAAALDAHARPMLEIERKYLLAKFPATAAGAPVEEIEQGYVPGDRLRERLRRVTTPDGVRWFRTVKTGAGLVRVEIEEETTREIFEAMWPLTEGKRVHKQRHRVVDGDLVWEIDHFVDRDLTLAEVELPGADVQPVPPDWLQPYVVRDVTDEPAYVNYNLAR